MKEACLGWNHRTSNAFTRKFQERKKGGTGPQRNRSGRGGPGSATCAVPVVPPSSPQAGGCISHTTQAKGVRPSGVRAASLLLPPSLLSFQEYPNPSAFSNTGSDDCYWVHYTKHTGSTKQLAFSKTHALLHEKQYKPFRDRLCGKYFTIQGISQD